MAAPSGKRIGLTADGAALAREWDCSAKHRCSGRQIRGAEFGREERNVASFAAGSA